MASPSRPCRGIRVLDLSTEIGGAYCTRLLADLGADVLMVEPPGGHPLRFHGPFPDGKEDPEKSGLFLHLCANKGGLTLDVESESGRARVLELAGQADLVVETFKPGRMEALGLGFDVLSARRPGLVVASITHFGQYGPYEQWEGEEIVDYALGGYMYFGGSPDREPLMVPNNQPQLQAGVQSAIACLTGIWNARKTGQAQHIDASSVEAMLSVHSWTHALWTHQGTVLQRTGANAVKCADGWVMFVMPYINQNFLLMIERPDLMDDKQVRSATWRTNHPEEMRPLLEQWCAPRTREEVFQAGQELRMPVAPVYDAADLFQTPYVAARNWFNTVDHPKAGTVQLPGFPYRLSATPASLRRPAPALGEEGAGWEEAAREDFSGSWPERPSIGIPAPSYKPRKGSDPPASLPFEGLRVVEVTNSWAGPLVGRMFGDLGADVLKIEPADRLSGRRSYFPGGQAFVHFYDRSAFNSKFNRNKYGMTVDLRSPEGKDIFLRLVRDADVVVENNSPRVMPNLGLGYEVLREVNPGLIMASISGFGQTGPGRDFMAYGANIEASCGLAAVTGYADDPTPYGTSIYYGDPIVGWHAVVAIMAALFHRRLTGEGQFIELSLQENAMGFFPEALLEYSLTGHTQQRLGNRHARYAPQGCYPCFGDDMWMVLTVRSDEEWGRLAKVLTLPEALDQRFDTIEGRREHHDEIDQLISRWTSRLDHHEASRRFQDVGVPAAPVLANWELISNLHYFERGFYIPIPHKEMGVFPYPGMPWQITGMPWALRMPPPLLGEHNRLVLTRLLGMDEAEIDDLCARGVLLEEVTPDFHPPVGVKRPPPL